MKYNLKLNYMPPNWNKYILLERSNMFASNNLKQKEKKIVRLATIGNKYEGNYPVKITFKPHFKDFRQDLDNFRYKGLLDGLVVSQVLENDNLRHVQKIVIEPVFDKEECVEIEIEEV